MTSTPAARAAAGDIDVDRLACEGNLRAGKRLVDAGYDLDQRALAAAVLARDALHFAGQDFEG